MAEEALPACLGGVFGSMGEILMDIVEDAGRVEGEVGYLGGVIGLVDHGEEDLVFCVDAFEAFGEGDAFFDEVVGEGAVCFPVAREEGEYGGIGGKVFHEGGWELGEVGGASGSRDVLEACSCEDGVDGVAHFVEESLDGVV